jgi:hypothetical protein
MNGYIEAYQPVVEHVARWINPMASVIIYQDKPDSWHYHAPTKEMRNCGGTTKKLLYVNGTLCLLDYESGARLVIIPVSRWKLIAIALNCIVAALKR